MSGCYQDSGFVFGFTSGFGSFSRRKCDPHARGIFYFDDDHGDDILYSRVHGSLECCLVLLMYLYPYPNETPASSYPHQPRKCKDSLVYAPDIVIVSDSPPSWHHDGDAAIADPSGVDFWRIHLGDAGPPTPDMSRDEACHLAGRRGTEAEEVDDVSLLIRLEFCICPR